MLHAQSIYARIIINCKRKTRSFTSRSISKIQWNLIIGMNLVCHHIFTFTDTILSLKFSRIIFHYSLLAIPQSWLVFIAILCAPSFSPESWRFTSHSKHISLDFNLASHSPLLFVCQRSPHRKGHLNWQQSTWAPSITNRSCYHMLWWFGV